MALTRPRFSQLDTGITKFSDPITVVNDKATLANVDIGLVFNRDGGATSNVAVIWDETNDQFALALTTDSGATNANVTISSYANLTINSLTAQSLTSLTVTGNSTISGNLDLNDADKHFVHGDTGYVNKRYVLYGTTSDATTTEIFVGGTSNSRVDIPTNNTVFYTVDIVARRTDATGESAGWQLKGVADNFSGTTADVGTVYEVAVARDDTNWAVDCLADDTEDAIIVTVTGAAGKTIKWMAVVKTMEVAN